MAPTGGEKDETPPGVSRTDPENLSTHFSENKISISFDEFVQQGDFSSQIFFSPALKNKPIYRLHGKTLSITLNDTLRPQTTYTINFGNAVKDITEGNIMTDFQYVFSTGSYIDSMRIQGNVKSAQDGKPKENVLVMLYNDLSDSAVAKERPTYNARTDKNGNFKIDHLKEDTFRLFALNDQNFNLLYDQPGEEVAFLDSSISIHDTSGIYSLVMFKPASETQKVLNAGSYQPGKTQFALVKRTDNLSILPITGNAENGILEYNASKDTISFWVNDLTSDSISFLIKDNDFSDTVRVRMKKVDEKEKIMPPALKIISPFKKGRGGQQEPDRPLILEFTSPLISIDENRPLRLINDSTKEANNIKAELIEDTLTRKKKAAINFPFEGKTSYSLYIPDSAFTDLFGNFNDSATIRFLTFENAETGNLFLKITTDSSKSYFYELRFSDGSMVAKQRLNQGFDELKFYALRPGKYTLILIEDMNKNNIWDTGDYWKHRQPEKIFSYSGDITLRANWDLELEMNIGGGKVLGKKQ